eukprot:TRINITY_DN10396_c0_g2_i2.p1 TRINITY_DN10396_c0_g2~~TRINITY_DN10396_c0_g2_i2.p1  ORF type:complete len:136 (+),score=37.37 TRINITY_DN10396_c0_g2_i2:134-541(+)
MLKKNHYSGYISDDFRDARKTFFEALKKKQSALDNLLKSAAVYIGVLNLFHGPDHKSDCPAEFAQLDISTALEDYLCYMQNYICTASDVANAHGHLEMAKHNTLDPCTLRCYLSLIHICRCRRYAVCRSRWSPYH